MCPATFEYVRAESMGHALELLERHGDDARLLAGGHSLIPVMKLRLAAPKVLIDIGRLRELQYIRQEGDKIAIGALTTHHQIEASALIALKAQALHDAARVVGDVQVRNRGTIGGVIAHADPMADYPAALLALDAEVLIAGRTGVRGCPMHLFFHGPFTTAMNPGEMIPSIRVPVQEPGSASVYRKFVRQANDYGMCGVSASLTVSTDGMCRAARIGITCVGMQPYRAGAVEDALVGRQLTPQVIEQAADRAVDGVSVNEDAYVPADYRSHLAKVETRRAIEEAFRRM